MPRRLATRLIFAVAIIVLIIKSVSLWIGLKSGEAQLLRSMTLGAEQLSRSITSATWHAMLADRREDAYQTMSFIAEKQGVQRIRMFNKDGRLMFSTEPGEELNLDQRAAVCVPCHSEETPLVSVDLPSRARLVREESGGRTIAMMTPIYNEPACSEADCHAHPRNVSVLGVLDLTIDAGGIEAEMRAERMRTGLLTFVEIALIGACLVFFTRRFVETPIRKLIGGTNAISEMQLDQPVTVRGSQELEQLAHSFDVMRVRLKEAMGENEKFTQKLESKVEERTAQLRVAERKLMHADRLASLGELAASVAHEINNPVSGVLNLSMLMQRILKDDGIPPGRVAEFKRYLGQVATETSRVGRIVSDLLSFSRRSKPQQTDADLNAIVRQTLSLVMHKLQLANVELELDLPEDLPRVRCDASQFQQVVINLVMNAAESIRGGGKVTVRTYATREGAERAPFSGSADDGKSVILEVHDTGSGIPRELLGKIFDPFFTTKEEGKGVGLGLAVVYGIVEAHGGEIEVESIVGEGSTFRVTLPLAPLPAPGKGHDAT